jgi:hypothetical protein
VIRNPLSILAVLCMAITGCNRRSDEPEAGKAVTIDVPVSAAAAKGVTPMAERVAVIALLNKRNGIVRDFTLKPGQAIRVKDAVIRLRACDSTAPWEVERLTGAFVQLDVQRSDRRWGRVFSGWLYKESPSLNVVEHPVYDVWVRSCAMSWPGAAEAPPSARGSSNASSAPKSGGGSGSGAAPPSSANETEPTPAAEPAPSAPESNAT